jgi:hypothetical protein
MEASRNRNPTRVTLRTRKFRRRDRLVSRHAFHTRQRGLKSIDAQAHIHHCQCQEGPNQQMQLGGC